MSGSERMVLLQAASQDVNVALIGAVNEVVY